MFGDTALQSTVPLQPSTFLPERPPSQDSTPTTPLLTSLRDTFEQYSSRISESTKRDVFETFQVLQNLCPTVEKLQSEAQNSVARNKEALSTVNGFYDQTAAVLQGTLKTLRPVHNESPLKKYITEWAKEIQEHLHSLSWSNSDLKQRTTSLEDDLNRLRSRERQSPTRQRTQACKFAA